ncbi:sigma-70 family RNA polymerase sigma factor [Pontiella agarivorans]|uniref:Sigma-70 family RNA polymerase sigma factor n=1 Tax=Pontiella agarivorans TaxID=3038953 RepID=A0ABU5MVR6_9BACT|nr:sigma-70 family RNA polymerase sigma factor [Pontiella agarivorans]MDZ8118217.1 sigma-70 family RNA polymerase sigma factor [Pontiella agarivorans]
MYSENEPQQWLEEHGDALFSYALSRLKNRSSAEDAVQETLLAALRSQDRFSGSSSVRTWLIGILKHKIVDLIRKEGREQPIDEIETFETPEEEFFDRKGRWRIKPVEWKVHPDRVLEQKEFMGVLFQCLEHLPDRLHRLFVLRELEEQDSALVCKELGITPTNLWVMLHRARMRLRGCLTENWFGAGT